MAKMLVPRLHSIFPKSKQDSLGVKGECGLHKSLGYSESWTGQTAIEEVNHEGVVVLNRRSAFPARTDEGLRPRDPACWVNQWQASTNVNGVTSRG